MESEEGSVSDLRHRIGTELTTIVTLTDALDDEASHRYSDASHIPGGDAEVMLGPAANYHAWMAQIDAAERAFFAAQTDVWIELSDDDSDPTPPLLILDKWAQLIHVARNSPTQLTPTIGRATDYIRDSIDWVLANINPAGVELMAGELTAVRIRLEAILHDGIRHDHTATVCMREHPPQSEETCGGQLVRRTLDRRDCDHVRKAMTVAEAIKQDPVYVLRIMLKDPDFAASHMGCDQGGRDDVYRCQTCNGYYTEAEYWLAVREHYERQAG